MTIINERGLNSLILRSRLPKAKEFRCWVETEVLPSIRKNGIYMTEQKAKEEENINSLQIFKNNNFGEIRTIIENDEILFCGADIAKSLGYSNTRKAIKDHCKRGTERNVTHPQNPEKTIEMKFIPESDVYRLIVKSKLPQAEQFEEWLFEEILPSIRKNGIYMTEQKAEEIISNPDLIIQLAKEVKENRKKIQKLEIQNQNLILNNKILAKETLNWENRSILNKSIRQLALILKVDFGVMWNKFYQEMKYKHHIDLKKRGKNRFVEYIKDTEWEKALSTIVALFEENDMDFAEFVKKEFSI